MFDTDSYACFFSRETIFWGFYLSFVYFYWIVYLSFEIFENVMLLTRVDDYGFAVD